MSALADMVCALPSERLVLAMGQAGDRLDDSIAAMTRAACRMNPDQLMICALPGYERGRSAGEVFAVIRGAAIAAGLDEASIREYSEPVAAAGYALEHAQKGDLLVFLRRSAGINQEIRAHLKMATRFNNVVSRLS
jgi:hypothetical protein